MEFAKRLKNIRTEKRFSKQELATIVGVSVVAIGHWEKGTRKPSCEMIVSLSEALSVTSDTLLGISSNSQILSQEELSLLDDFRKLDSYGRKAVASVCSIERARVLETIHRKKERP